MVAGVLDDMAVTAHLPAGRWDARDCSAHIAEVINRVPKPCTSYYFVAVKEQDNRNGQLQSKAREHCAAIITTEKHEATSSQNDVTHWHASRPHGKDGRCTASGATEADYFKDIRSP